MPSSAALRERPPDETAPSLEWDDFLTYVFDWRQNQHVGVVGPTEQGKTNLTYHLLQFRRYITYFAIKTKDATLDAFAEQGGYKRITDWPPKKGRFGRQYYGHDEMPKRLLWPDATQLDSEPEQQRVFGKALRDIYANGGWCPVFDDYWYLAHILKFEKQTKKFLANARSNDIPMVVCAQRPAGNRLVELFDQSTHLFFARDNDKSNLDRIAGVGWLDSDVIRAHVAHLDRYQFLYVNTRSGDMYRTTAPELALG
ncbi:MAG TPA: hypothetical protein VGG75_42600 [Trebonia sp.]|jgi:hypothetical protein